MLGLELDYLMSETGHLMGRAWGKVYSGYDTLKDLVSLDSVSPEDTELMQLAMWNMEDGLVQLELIRQNFYAFRERRLGVNIQESTQSMGDETTDIAPVRQTIEPADEVDVVALLQDLGPLFRRLSDEFDQEVRFSMGSPSAVTRGPENSLRLVFINLFDNATKFSYGSTYIEITLTTSENQCVVIFANLGIGVAPDERRRVFRPLTKSRFKDPYRRIEGLGLGLSFCQKVIEDEFDGTIDIFSREVHTPHRRFEGDNWLTTVTIRLPLWNSRNKESLDAKDTIL
jgi:signal transduction histidine kinase